MPPSAALKSLFATYVLTTLVFGTVESYKCVSCPLYTCSAETQTTCETSQSCFSHREELKTTGGLSQFSKEKGCASSSCVPLVFSATLGGNQTFGYARQCCQDELCNKRDFQLPQKSSHPNGIHCPACYSVNDISCEPVLLTCTGTETRCVHAIGGSTFMIFAMGCATETACNLKNASLLNNIYLYTYCIQGNAGPQLVSFTSSILTGLFLLKVLL